MSAGGTDEAAEKVAGEKRERRDSFGAGKRAHWDAVEEAGGSHNAEAATFEEGAWKHVEMLQSADFDAKITFNPDKVFMPVVIVPFSSPHPRPLSLPHPLLPPSLFLTAGLLPGRASPAPEAVGPTRLHARTT